MENCEKTEGKGWVVKKPVTPLLRWLGGKRKIAAQIAAMMPAHTTYVEPFCGAAAVLLAKEPSKHEVLNDCNGDLINLYQMVKYHPHEFKRQLRGQINSKTLLDEHLTNMQRGTDIQRAASFFYVIGNNFGGRVGNSTFGRNRGQPSGFNPDSINRRICAFNKRIARVTLECGDWMDVLQYYDAPDALYYLDPPYHKTTGYGVDFGDDQYIRLADAMTSMQGKAILSLNDTPFIRATFAEFTMQPIIELRTLANAARGNGKKAACLLIYKG